MESSSVLSIDHRHGYFYQYTSDRHVGVHPSFLLLDWLWESTAVLGARAVDCSTAAQLPSRLPQQAPRSVCCLHSGSCGLQRTCGVHRGRMSLRLGAGAALPRPTTCRVQAQRPGACAILSLSARCMPWGQRAQRLAACAVQPQRLRRVKLRHRMLRVHHAARWAARSMMMQYCVYPVHPCRRVAPSP